MDKCYSPAVYGPVESRRVGRSLGVNLLPLSRKACSFDCVYCECGKSRTNIHIMTHTNSFLDPRELRQEIERCFHWHSDAKTLINYISFAGNGEPTLYPWFEDAVNIVIEMRDKYLANLPTAIFTNATFSLTPNLMKALCRFDQRFVKLDAGDPNTYRLIDKPARSCSFETILSNLSKLKDIAVSTAVVDGVVSNITSLKSEDFVKIIDTINPLRVFIYAIDRPTTYPGIFTVPRSTLYEIKDFLKTRLDIPITVLRSKTQRPSWFDESYGHFAPIAPPVVYATEKKRSCYSTPLNITNSD